MEAPKQIVMQNPISLSSVQSKIDLTETKEVDESIKSTDCCICWMYACFFVPGCIGACMDCCI